MKHTVYILFLAVLFLSVCGCERDYDRMDSNSDGCEISFDGGFVDRQTKSTPSMLSEYADSMGVWGWQTKNGDTLAIVFNNQKVKYESASSSWKYSPLKYWDTQSTYKFLAYAPYNNGGQCTVSYDKANLKLTNVETKGVNLQATPSSAEKNTFKGTDEIDWMIARAGQAVIGKSAQRYPGYQVSFSMQHILAKFNVRAKVSMSGVSSVKINSFSISQLSANGDFTQQSVTTPAPGSGKTEWTTDITFPKTVSLLGPDAEVTLSSSWTYIQESLLIPQPLKATQQLRLKYTLTFTDSSTETYTYTSNLKDLFATESIDKLWAGYNYILSFIIKEDSIEFDAGTSEWQNGISVNEGI